jgi:hypothetical protein
MNDLAFSFTVLVAISIVALAYQVFGRNRYRNTVEEFPDKGYNVVYNEYSGSVVITDEAKFEAHLQKLHKELLEDLRKQGIYL